MGFMVRDLGTHLVVARIMNQTVLDLDLPAQRWRHVKRNDPRCRELADRHYSRQTIGAVDFMSNGKTFVLFAAHPDGPYEKIINGIAERFSGTATWGCIENMDGGHHWHFRCSIFRNETPWLSSDLVREATTLTQARWMRRFQWVGSPPLRTEIDPERTRRKRDPGRCFLKAGWRSAGETAKGLIVLEAPWADCATS